MIKAVQFALSRGVAELSGTSGVAVNFVLPGPTRSEEMGNDMEGIAPQPSATNGTGGGAVRSIA